MGLNCLEVNCPGLPIGSSVQASWWASTEGSWIRRLSLRVYISEHRRRTSTSRLASARPDSPFTVPIRSDSRRIPPDLVRLFPI